MGFFVAFADDGTSSHSVPLSLLVFFSRDGAVDFFVDCFFVGLTELCFWKCFLVDSLFAALVNYLIVSFPDLDITLTSFVFEPDGGFKEYSEGVLLLWDSLGGVR